MGYPHFPEERQGKGSQMELTLYDLKNIVSAVERAQQAKVNFTGDLVVGRHRVSVRWKHGEDQRDSDQLLITGIRHV